MPTYRPYKEDCEYLKRISELAKDSSNSIEISKIVEMLLRKEEFTVKLLNSYWLDKEALANRYLLLKKGEALPTCQTHNYGYGGLAVCHKCGILSVR